MKTRTFQFTPMNLFKYLSGVFILCMGAVSGIISNLGAGPWDTAPYNLSLLLRITPGGGSAIVMGTIFIITTILNKQLKPYILVNIIIVPFVIDFWYITVFNEYVATTFITGLPYFIVALLMIPLGLSLIITSTVPAMVFDELTFAVMRTFHFKSLSFVRIGIEFTGISLGILFGYLNDGTMGTVGFGSILLAIVIGPMISIYLRLLGDHK